MPNFADILNKTADSVEKPKPKPVGTYLAQVNGLPKQTQPTVNGEERLVLEFPFKLMSAQQVDDQDALLAAGDISTWPAVKQSFWPDTPEGEYNLIRFLTETLGIAKKGKTTGEMLSEVAGKQLLVTLKHRPYQNKQTGEAEIATDVERTAAV